MEFLNYHFAGNDVSRWLIALFLVAFSITAFGALKEWLHRRIEIWSKKTETKLDDMLADTLGKTKKFFLWSWAIFIGISMLSKAPELSSFFEKAIMIVSMLQVAIWGSAMIAFSIDNYLKAKGEKDADMASTIGLVNLAAKFAFYSMIFLLVLHNLGFNISALLAGLGVGGIAVALAVQNILGDVFASLTIVLDKPFVVGDFVVVGDKQGTIERIGLKTTRIRALSGEQLIFCNNDLLQSRIHNFKRMQERRILFTVGVTYQTPAHQLEKISQIIQNIIKNQAKARFDRCHFKNLGSSALEYEVVYWMTESDYNLYMDTQQAINLALFKAFEAEKIEFAYPTQMVFHKQL